MSPQQPHILLPPFDIFTSLTFPYESSKTCLHMMVRNDMLSTIELVLAIATMSYDAKATTTLPTTALITATDRDDATLLFAAAATGAQQLLAYLVDLKADLNHAQSAGATPLHLAATSAGSKTMGLLIRGGADLNVLDKNHFSPFFLAAKTGNADALTCLYEAGADMSLGAENGAEPLYVAAQLGRRMVIDKLVEWGADVNCNGTGHRPLHIAVMLGHGEAVEALLKAGADTDVEGGEQVRTSPCLMHASHWPLFTSVHTPPAFFTHTILSYCICSPTCTVGM